MLEKNHPALTSDAKEFLGSLLGMDKAGRESGDIDEENEGKDEDNKCGESAKIYHQDFDSSDDDYGLYWESSAMPYLDHLSD